MDFVHGVVYSDPGVYAAFPSACRTLDGEIITVFRQAPRRREITHLDPASRAVAVRSRDGTHWSEPEIAWEWPSGGEWEGSRAVQDPSIACLRNGTLLLNFFTWRVYAAGVAERRIHPSYTKLEWSGVVEGIHVSRSPDGGRTWTEPALVATPGYAWGCGTSDAILETSSGDLLLPAYGTRKEGEKSSAFVLRSEDGGRTWSEPTIIALDPDGQLPFGEPALVEVSPGHILAWMRSFDRSGGTGSVYQTESRDGGRTWLAVRELPVWGYPAQLTSLGDGHVLAVYGYRREPLGVRAARSTDGGMTWQEFTLRADGRSTDLGYPSALSMADGSVLVVYYFDDVQGPGRICSTRLRLQSA